MQAQQNNDEKIEDVVTARLMYLVLGPLVAGGCGSLLMSDKTLAAVALLGAYALSYQPIEWASRRYNFGRLFHLPTFEIDPETENRPLLQNRLK